MNLKKKTRFIIRDCFFNMWWTRDDMSHIWMLSYTISIEYILYTYHSMYVAQTFFSSWLIFFANILQANFSLLLSSFYTKVMRVENDTFCNPFTLKILKKSEFLKTDLWQLWQDCNSMQSIRGGFNGGGWLILLDTLQMFTGVYGVPVGFPCNINGKMLEESQRNPILLKGKDPACYGETL